MTDVAVHPEFAANGSFGHLRLGRVAPAEGAKLMLGPYIAETFEPAPASVDFYSAVPSFPMYGNDNLGDCTWAAIGHLIQAWTQAAGTLVTPADKDIEEGYWLTGQPPSTTGTPGSATDDGRVETRVLSYWRGKGVPNSGDRIVGYASIAARNLDRVRFAIANFGGAYIGLALPLTAERQSVWDYVPNDPANQPGSWGGHAVPILGYDADFLYVVTWGFVMKMTWAFWQHYGDACYAVISTDFARKAQAAGVNIDAMKKSIDILTSPDALGAVLPADGTPATSASQEPAEPASAAETPPGDAPEAPPST